MEGMELGAIIDKYPDFLKQNCFLLGPNNQRARHGAGIRFRGVTSVTFIRTAL